MNKRSDYIFRFFVVFGDSASIFLSFLFAYLLRMNLDTRPYFFEERPIDFLTTFVFLIPFWLILLASLELYKKKILLGSSRSPEFFRLLFASVLGTMSIIAIGYFKQENLFPVRPVAIYSTVLCLVFLLLFRTLIRTIYRLSLKKSDRGVLRAVIIGNSANTTFLADYIAKNPASGYRIAGIVAGRRYLPRDLKIHQYQSLKDALRKSHPDVVFQTDERQTEYVYKQSLNYHLPYYFVPSEAALSSQLGDLELVGNIPAILVKVTPLSGPMRFIKRFFDLLLGGLATLLALPIMAIVFLLVKLSDPRHRAFYSEIRLTRHNNKFKIYKFRTMKPEFSGLSPEEAFIKMNKPELIKKYRKNGDYLEHDPRVTKLGAFLRRSSLDELPQLFNIVRGDISLVGPRALVPGELRNYGDRSLLLSVKSGLTGLAQVSGRRNISFAERRSIDLYYVQNWSLFLDFQILLRTIGVVLRGEGAK
ncbi:exopolysaccharide biosynthesis polyprenyl glycosylphosphotransferase [Candidatus Saccharibacteria bacterium]|nr:exopolysaccharide biosynthesis polyprenyl glycosylphosphotransferase [Candidatus Saccharibacteria bacterium]